MARRPKQQKYDCIVIGAGMGGLGTAALLAQQGLSVLVVERHYRAGGYAHSFRRHKYTFDSAVRIVAGAEQGLLHDLLGHVGLADSLPFIKLDEVYSAFYPEHAFTVHRTVEGLIEAYSQQFEHERDNILALVAEMEALYQSTIEMLHAKDPFSVLSDPMIMKYRTVTFHDMLAQFLQDEKAIYAFASLWAYFGASPVQGSAMYFAYAIMSYFKEDIYYIKGSFQSLADAYVKRIEELGGEVCLRNEVKQIVVEDKQVRGVRLETGEYVEADRIVCNGDLRKMITDLVGEEHFPTRYLKKVKGMSVAMSAFEVFIGTDLPIEKLGLAHETFVYNMYDYEAIFNRHADLKNLGVEGLSGLALSCPTLADPTLAPEGKHTVVLTTLVPYDIGEDWKDAKLKYQAKLIEIAEQAIPGLSQHLDFVESGTPLTMERYTHNSFGSIYGWEQNLKQMTSRPSQEAPIKGLYLTGHWTDPGGGVVSVLLSSYKLFKKMMS